MSDRGHGTATLSAPPEVLRIERKTVAMQALERLRERILRGEFLEGAPLRQDALAAALGVSRIPVREALRQLEAEGLVTFSPHVGAVVSTLTLGEIEELFDLRALIEPEVLRQAIPLARTEHLVRARRLLQEFDAVCRSEDLEAWGALNSEFHAALLEPAGQPLTMGVLRYLHNQSNRYTRLRVAVTRSQSRSLKEHAEILEAVERREVRHARALLASHILGAGRALLEFLGRQRAAPATPTGRDPG